MSHCYIRRKQLAAQNVPIGQYVGEDEWKQKNYPRAGAAAIQG
jgi:hypothetical protein